MGKKERGKNETSDKKKPFLCCHSNFLPCSYPFVGRFGDSGSIWGKEEEGVVKEWVNLGFGKREISEREIREIGVGQIGINLDSKFK